MRLVLNSFLAVTGYQNKHENYTELTENTRVFFQIFCTYFGVKAWGMVIFQYDMGRSEYNGRCSSEAKSGGMGENPPYDK